VKIGQTSNWKNRRKAYANWNLRFGDGITVERVFLITEEYVDLIALEAEILSRARSLFHPHHGLEWFKADMDDVCRLIDEVMCEGGLSYADG
jgi:hypothetical protein